MSSPVTVHVALMPSVIGCRGSAVCSCASPHGRGRSPSATRELGAAHDVVLLGVAPVVLLRGGAVEPHDALAVVVHELQQRGIRLRPEADGLLVVAVAALEDDDDDVVPVDDARHRSPRGSSTTRTRNRPVSSSSVVIHWLCWRKLRNSLSCSRVMWPDRMSTFRASVTRHLLWSRTRRRTLRRAA